MGDMIDFPGLELVGAVAGEVTPKRLDRGDCISAPEGRYVCVWPPRPSVCSE